MALKWINYNFRGCWLAYCTTSQRIIWLFWKTVSVSQKQKRILNGTHSLISVRSLYHPSQRQMDQSSRKLGLKSAPLLLSQKWGRNPLFLQSAVLVHVHPLMKMRRSWQKEIFWHLSQKRRLMWNFLDRGLCLSLVSESLKTHSRRVKNLGSTPLPLWPICQSDHNRTIKAFFNKWKLVLLVLHVTCCTIDTQMLEC